VLALTLSIGSVLGPWSATTLMAAGATGWATDREAGVEVARDVTRGAELAIEATAFHAVWMRQFGTTELDSVSGVAVDRHGNAYVVGCTPGRFAGQRQHGYYDAYLRKVSSDGAHRWTRQFGTANLDCAEGVAVGRDDDIYVVGTDDDGAFLRRFRPTGQTVWLRHFGRNSAQGSAVAVDNRGRVVIGGKILGRDDDWDAFVRAYTPRGNAIWTRRFGAASATDGTVAIAPGPGNALFVAGFMGGKVGDPNGSDAFVRKLDSAGNRIWSRRFGTDEHDGANDVAVAASGASYVVGFTRGTFVDPPVQDQEGDGFVRAFDSDGNERWTRVLGVDFFASAASAEMGRDGTVRVVGLILGSAPGMPGDGDDGFLLSYDNAGSIVDSVRIGSRNDGDQGVGVAVSPNGDAYVAGWTEGVLPGRRRIGGWDGFLVKIRQ
jgi:hypothetical protein